MTKLSNCIACFCIAWFISTNNETITLRDGLMRLDSQLRSLNEGLRRVQIKEIKLENQDLKNPVLRKRAAQITSTFENSTTELQYGFAKDIGDKRGITAGRAGFTSATNDLLQVVKRYTARKPNNLLAPYIPALEKVNGTSSKKRT